MSRFLDNVRYGEIEKVRKHLQKGHNVNDEQNGKTALILAIMQKNLSMVQLLLNNGANPNSINKNNGETALIIAVKLGNADIVRALIAGPAAGGGGGGGGGAGAGANLNLQARNNDTALIAALKNDKIQIANILLDAGANIATIGEGGTAAIDIARWKAQNDPNFDQIVNRIAPPPPPVPIALPALTQPPVTARIPEENNRCAICMEDYNNGNSLCILNCNHIFHENCIRGLLLVASCPKCRVPITSLRQVIIDPTPGGPTPNTFFGGYYNKYQKYITKINKIDN
jgi:hypothetical protein